MPVLPDWAQWRAEQLVILLHVQPGARRTAVVGVHGSRLKIALHAPPVDGKANAELLRFFCAQLNLRPGQVQLLSGAASRQKAVAVGAAADAAGALAARLLAAAR